ncbi:addiction module toxin, HicA family [Candidatus Wolfebacteria bacterium CG1_02_39_135]|uniref:Addiction module toxin, HicA family n=2 Tax=Candidatus Wolfeibacteriota TaxID=1752735 RepID=A0A2M7B592_9BACT|nr:MAG: addiction module toxin, HicA family [Candidatus Wolfebacteria bacterium CG1_02_39_135]PIU98189.1 MAG: addiction module toxin, HicA family [Candidatus Wolfebacteria bacterium CG03_land_8_20_14_0_80_40_12]
MKRNNFINHLIREGCIFIREGAKHSVFFNPITKRTSTVPRHNEINNFLARKICRDLGIKEIKNK